LYRGINGFKKGKQPRSNIVKNEKCDLFTVCHIILARWRTHFSQLFIVHGVIDIRQTDIHTIEPLVPEPSAFEVKMNIEILKRHKSAGIDQIPADWFEAEGRKMRYEIHKFIKSFGIRRYCLKFGTVRSLYLSIRRVKKKTRT
jgi:hypothetical protein